MFDPYDPAIRRVRARLATLPWEQEGFVGQVLSRESSDGLLDYLNVSPVPMPPWRCLNQSNIHSHLSSKL